MQLFLAKMADWNQRMNGIPRKCLLIAITLLVLFSRLSKATGRKIAGATSALDADAGSEAESLAEDIDENKVKNLNPDGSFQ